MGMPAVAERPAPEADTYPNGVAEDGFYRLTCKAQCYAWGMSAQKSEVASLCRAAGQHVNTDAPYAELWMGTHPSGPSTLRDEHAGVSLSALLAAHPGLLGAATARFGSGGLPFLFKVLSIGGALSIQSHPDKALAERLHAQQPEAYRDDNHKPEMVLALTPCTALCGFAGEQETEAVLAEFPELRDLAGAAVAQGYVTSAPGTPARAAALRALFTAVVTAEESAAGDAVDALVARLGARAAGSLSDKEALVLDLAGQYPRDVGVLAALLLRHLALQPGEGLALPANVPHAYLSGQALEAMACSDNVIRAGLTPKFRDTRVLCESLRYEQQAPTILRGQRVAVDRATKDLDASGAAAAELKLYRPTPPFPEFELWTATVTPGATLHVPPAAGPALVLVQTGKGRAGSRSLSRGDVFFVAAGTALHLQVDGSEETKLELAATTCNGMGFGSWTD